jgi:hypothetical protein
MAFPTIPTVAAGRVLSVNQLNNTATRTFPNLSSLTKSSGDLLIAIVVGYQSSTTNAQFSSWGAGFTEFHDSGTSSTLAIGMAYKWSNGSETGTFTVTQAGTITGDATMILLSIPGAHPTTPPEAGSRADGTTAAADPAAFNPAGWGTEETLWIAVHANGMTNASGSWTATGTGAPANYGSRVDTNASDTSTIGDVELEVSFRQAAVGSEDVGASSGTDTSNARNSSVVIAVRPSPLAVLDQAAYRFYADGTETGSTAIAAQNTGIVADLASSDLDLHLRVRLQENGTAAVSASDFQLEYDINTSGAWSEVNSGDFAVPSIDGPNLTNGAATTNRLTGGTGSFEAGKISEDGTVDALGWGLGNHTELLYSIRLVSAEFSDEDIVDFRVLQNFNPLSGYTQTPTVEISKTAGPVTHNGAVAMTAPSVLTTAGVKTTAGAAAMTAPSTLTTAAVRTAPAAVTMSAPSTLTAAAVRTTPAAVAMTAGSVLTANATVSSPGTLGTYRTHGSYRAHLTYRSKVPAVTYQGAVTMTAPSTLTVAAVRTTPAAVAMTAPSTLTTAATVVKPAAVAMTAPSVLTSAATRATSAAVAMTAPSALVAAAVRSTAGSVTMVAPSTLTVAGIRTTGGAVVMTAASVLTVAGFKTTAGTVAMTAPSVLTAAGTAGTDSFVSMFVPSVLSVTAFKSTAGAVAMAAPSVLTVGAIRTTTAAVAMQAASTLTATGVRTTFAAIVMTAPSVLTSAAVVTKLGGVNMTAPSALAVGAGRTTTGIVSMFVPSVLSAGAIKTQPASVAMTAASVLIVAAVRTQLAAVSMAANSTLTAGAIPVRLASVMMTAVSVLLANPTAYTPTGSPFYLWTGFAEEPLTMAHWNGTSEDALTGLDFA